MESRFPLAGMENSFKNTFLLDEKLLPLTVISKNPKKMVGNSNNKGFK